MQESGRILEEIEGLEAKYTKASYDILFGAGALAMAGEVKEVIQKFLDGQKSTNDGWIPVEEHLPEICRAPEEDDECPEFNVTIRGAERATTLKYSPADGTWFDDNGIVYNVIAWRPLPEPYRQESDTKKPDWRQDMLRKFDGRE